MWIIKILGVILVVFCCGAMGTNMALILKKRVKSLTETLFFIDSAAAYIMLGASDIDVILAETLPKGMAFDGKGLIAESSLCFTDADREIITAFLCDMGMSDSQREIKRCASFKELIASQLKKAERDVEERYRLFLICGWLTGIILSLLWW